MEDNRADELDRTIDRVLGVYAGAEPVEGLEQRVIRRVRTDGPVPGRNWWFRAAVALPALAALIVAIALVRVPPKTEPAANTANPNAPVAPAVRPPAPAADSAHEREFQPRSAQRATRMTMLRERRAGLAVPVKEPLFPAPAPMTHEERVLTAWASRMPAEVANAFADLRKRAGEPVSVQEIQLPPLPAIASSEEQR